MLNRILGIACFVGLSAMAVAQQPVRVHGFFRVDSASVGEVIPFVLTASYPSDQQVLFPDSTFSFAPFESSGKRFFPTHTTGAMSYDSAVYFLSTFEIDSVQSLMLPIFVLHQTDCVAVFSSPDSVRLRYLVTMALDSIAVEKLPLKISTAYQHVKWILNYPILLFGILVLILLGVVGWVVFGKRIRKYFALRRLKKNYEIFLSRFNLALDTLGSESSNRKAEEVLVLWKRYMEDLEEYPYTKSTSREILRKISNAGLGNALRRIDRGIYGGYEATVEPFLFLQSYSQEQFQKREAEVRNG